MNTFRIQYPLGSSYRGIKEDRNHVWHGVFDQVDVQIREQAANQYYGPVWLKCRSSVWHFISDLVFWEVQRGV